MSLISYNSLKGRMKQQKMHHCRRLNKMRFNKFQFSKEISFFCPRSKVFVGRIIKSIINMYSIGIMM